MTDPRNGCKLGSEGQDLRKSKSTKEGRFKTEYLSRVHPSVRAEWKLLCNAERKEKERPENAGCLVRLNKKKNGNSTEMEF